MIYYLLNLILAGVLKKIGVKKKSKELRKTTEMQLPGSIGCYTGASGFRTKSFCLERVRLDF